MDDEHSNEVIIECPAGTVVGTRSDGVFRAMGIRYARALRFELPQPEPRATSPLAAGERGPACPQPSDLYAEPVLGDVVSGLSQDEDCLRLSVARPADTAHALPVMVWIHGGSYINGAGDSPYYDPCALVREQQVVVVNVSYRLGLFGFLGDSADRPPNLGLFDLIEALRWIRRNIAAFGGDPENVTLFGESAGGDAIAHLMIAEGTSGLFRRVIIQSAPFGISRGREQMHQAMLRKLDAPNREMPVVQILSLQTAAAVVARAFGLRGGMPFGPQLGCAPLPDESDADLAWTTVAPRIDALVGHTRREVGFFVPSDPALSRLAKLPIIGRVLAEMVIRLMTLKIYGVGAFARRHRRGGGRVFRYELDWGVPGNAFRATHTSDLPLLLGATGTWERTQLMAGFDKADFAERGRQLRKLWADYGRTGALPEFSVRRFIRVQRG